MTKNLRFLAVACFALLVSALGSQQIEAQCVRVEGELVGVNSNQFCASRDTGIAGHSSEQMFGVGGQGRHRPLKSNQNMMVIDFDSGQLGGILAANPGKTATWTLHLRPQEATDFDANEVVGIQTVESTNDWVEGDGTADSNFGWSDGTASATYFYAQTVHDGGVLDTAASVLWNDPDSGPYTMTNRSPANATYGVPTSGANAVPDANPTPEFTNSVDFSAADFTNAWNAPLGSPAEDKWASIVLDNNIINAIINDVNNRGIRTGRNFVSPGVVDNSNSGNFRVYSKDQSGGIFAPYLEVTFVDGVAGDFDGDSDVDGADFLKWQRDGLPAGDLTLWQNNYPPASVATVGAVPEPSSIALLALSSAMLLGRRRSRS